jgi:predicted ester cyclase
MADTETIRRNTTAFYEGLFNQHDVEAARTYLADGFTDHVIPPGMDQSREGFIAFCGQLFEGFPDLSVSIDEMIVSGDRVAIRSTWRGTNEGQLALPDGSSIPATGKSAQWEGIDIARVDDEARALEHWGIFDVMAMMGQLGLLPPPA